MTAKKPNLFVVGAPRGGTSRIYELFKSHPEINVCDRKEPYFYSPLARNGRFKSVAEPVEDIDQYLSMFQFTEEVRYYAETSTTYCWDPSTPKLIIESCDNSRIVFVLRDPIERFYSHYLHHVSRYKETRKLKEVLSDGITPNNDTWNAHIFQSGLYAKNIKRFKEVFPDNQICILRFEDINADPIKTFSDIQSFLNLRTPFSASRNDNKVNAQFARKNSMISFVHNLRNKIYPKALPFPNSLKKVYHKHLLLPSLSDSERKAIKDAYIDDQAELKKLLGWSYF